MLCRVPLVFVPQQSAGVHQLDPCVGLIPQQGPKQLSYHNYTSVSAGHVLRQAHFCNCEDGHSREALGGLGGFASQRHQDSHRRSQQRAICRADLRHDVGGA